MTTRSRRIAFGLIKGILPLLILALGVLAAMYFMKTGPSVPRSRPEPRPVPVQVTPARLQNATVEVTSMGTVVPSREITLRAQVSGKVVSVDEAFLPGGRVADQAELVRIDPRDYEIEVHKKESAVERARADLRLEEGQQEVARQEYRLLRESTDSRLEESDLALRKPQLLQARADLSSTLADLDQARLDLSRTVVRAPFNALITERNVNLGSTVNVQDSLATLISLDEYWIEVLVPLGQLPFLNLQQSDGCPVDIASQTGAGMWSGKTIGLTGTVDEESRMATVLISVCNPLDGPQPLMLGDYVTTVIQGRNLDGVIELPRSALRQNSTVWLHDQGHLRMQPVRVAWKAREVFYVTGGLQPGQLVVTSDISTPVQGMLIAVQNGTSPLPGQDPAPQLRRSVNTDRNATNGQPELSSGSGAGS